MTELHENYYVPDRVSHSGETLAETIEALRITPAKLAEQAGMTTMLIDKIIVGKASISPEIALVFERVLGVPAVLWMALELNYRDYISRTTGKTSAAGS